MKGFLQEIKVLKVDAFEVRLVYTKGIRKKNKIKYLSRVQRERAPLSSLTSLHDNATCVNRNQFVIKKESLCCVSGYIPHYKHSIHCRLMVSVIRFIMD